MGESGRLAERYCWSVMMSTYLGWKLHCESIKKLEVIVSVRCVLIICLKVTE